MREYPRTIPAKYLQEAIRQTRRVVYHDDWTPVFVDRKLPHGWAAVYGA